MTERKDNNRDHTWLFVYGTLMKGFKNHELVRPYVLKVEEARFNGRLYHLPAGYPMAVEGKGVVHGQLLQLDDDADLRKMLDYYEDYRPGQARSSLYVRKIKPVIITGKEEKIMAHIYLVPDHKSKWLERVGAPVPGGDWRVYMGNDTERKKGDQ